MPRTKPMPPSATLKTKLVDLNLTISADKPADPKNIVDSDIKARMPLRTEEGGGGTSDYHAIEDALPNGTDAEDYIRMTKEVRDYIAGQHGFGGSSES